MVLFNPELEGGNSYFIPPKGTRPKVNVIARLEFELATKTVQHFSHYTTETPLRSLDAIYIYSSMTQFLGVYILSWCIFPVHKVITKLSHHFRFEKSIFVNDYHTKDDLVSLFNGISTFISYLMPKLFWKNSSGTI